MTTQKPTELSVKRAIEAYKLPAYTVDEAVQKYENREFTRTFLADIHNVALAFDAQDQAWQARVEAARMETLERCASFVDNYRRRFPQCYSELTETGKAIRSLGDVPRLAAGELGIPTSDATQT